MNTAGDGQQIAIIKDKKTVKLYVTDEDEERAGVKFFNKLDLKGDQKFEVVPDPKKDRTSIFIVGRNGSGKSYWISDYVKHFIKAFPKYQIRLFSSKDTDDQLDSIKQIKRVKIDNSFITDPLDYKDLEESLVIFDDIDGFRNLIRKELYHLRDIILKNGRSLHIHIISTNHDSVGRDVQAPLNESDMIVFFLRNYNRSMRYLLENYIGLEHDQAKILRKNKSRATTYIKTYPNVIIQERNAYLLDAIE